MYLPFVFATKPHRECGFYIGCGMVEEHEPLFSHSRTTFGSCGAKTMTMKSLQEMPHLYTIRLIWCTTINLCLPFDKADVDIIYINLALADFQISGHLGIRLCA